MNSIHLPVSLNELTKINAEIEHIVSGDPELVFKLQLIVEEILTNIAKYAYSESEDNKYLNFICGYVYFDHERAVLLQFVYGGAAFDPFVEVAEPDITKPMDERDIGGLGIHLIKEIATHYTYARIDDYNQVQIYLNEVAPAASAEKPQV